MSNAAPSPAGVEKPHIPARLPRPEWVYLALALAFGGAFVALTPPFQVPDEEAHFRRAFQLSEGHVFARKEGGATGDDLPRAVEAVYGRFEPIRQHPAERTTAAAIREAAAVALEPSEREFVGFSNTAIHPPLTYLPQALGVFLARLFFPSVLAGFYAGRLLNLLTAAAVTFLAVRITPVGKWAFAVLALTPMALFMAASLSSDALTNALAFLLVAQVLALALGPGERVPFRSVGWAALSAAALGLAKQMYFFLPLSYFLVPARKLGGARRYAAALALVTGAALLAVAGWSLVVREIYSPPDARYGMDPAEQWRLMRQDPAGFLRVLLGTAQRAPVYGQEYLGWLGSLDTQLPVWLYLAEAALLVAVCAAEFGPCSGVTVRQALVAAGVVSLVTSSILVIIHLTWDTVGAPYVVVQGRYFIPLGPLAGLALGRFLGGLAPRALGGALRVVPAVAASAVPVLLAAALVRVHDRYYVDSDLARAERCYTRGQDVLKRHGPPEQARELFAEALRLDPDHPGANYLQGYELRHARPREAAEHFRAALRREPKHVPTLSLLAGVLARQGEYPEAIRLYRQVLELEPDNASARSNLGQAVQEQKATADFLHHLPAKLREMARSRDLLEERHRGQALQGVYLKPIRTRIAALPGELGAPLVWRSPPPGGEELCLEGPAAAGAPFFACSAGPLLGTKWVFVFPARAALLADDEVSWYYQRPLAELTDDQRRREGDYRAGRRLRFPLAAPPD